MKKIIVCREKDFLTDISSVVSPNLTKRVDWVSDCSDRFTSSYRLHNAGEMCIQTPPFAVVTSIERYMYPYRSNERYIVSVNLCDSIDATKEYIQDKLINAPANFSAQVDLFAYNGYCFEKVPYSVGYYEKTTTATDITCDLDGLEKNFYFEDTVKRKPIEEPVVDENFDEEKKLYIELTDYWEVYYGDKKGYHTKYDSEIFKLKNLESVIEEVLMMMLDNADITQATIENSWYTVVLMLDTDRKTPEDEESDWCEAFDDLKKAVRLEITLNY